MAFDPARLMTESLHRLLWGERLARVMAAGLTAVEPGEAVRRALQREGNQLIVVGKKYDLPNFRQVFLIGAGKAGAPMAAAVEEILGDQLATGVVIVKEGYASRSGNQAFNSRVEILEAGHPLPDQRGLDATEKLMCLLERVEKDDLVICLLSGGGSALLTAPMPGITLSDLQSLTSLLLQRGATIQEINTLRKHLDRVKGGRLARLVNGATLLTLILSDVVGDSLEVIASGPTSPDPTTYQDAAQILDRFHLWEDAPVSVISVIKAGLSGEIADTPKPGAPIFTKVQNEIVANNLIAAQSALQQARIEGFQGLLLTTEMQGEARQVGRKLAEMAYAVIEQGRPLARPACLLMGGETIVLVRGQGLGGRNQEFALGAVPVLAGLDQVALIALATDGGDGPTDAAGAVVTGETLTRAKELGLDPERYLASNDSYHFFSALGDLLKPGPTQTNVNDLAFLFVL